jgi:alkyl sulfatase BDS1-like metallo-beta-lactamase superfamily hydrolase
MLRAVETSLALSPEVIVPGHSRILRGRQEIDSIMTLTRDAIAFLIDQVNRFVLSGRSVDDLLDSQHLPPAIAAHPDLQPYYHRWEWMARQRFMKLVGFIDDSMDYLSLNTYEEARRLVPLLGGRDRVLALADTSVEGDPRWAARLATYLILVEREDQEALAVRQNAFLKVAQTTNSANERNYLLGLILEENGEIDFNRQLAPLNERAYSTLPNDVLLQRLKYRFRAEAADGVELVLQLRVDADNFSLTVANNVLHVRPAAAAAADATMTRAELVAVVARTQALDQLSGWDGSKADQLSQLIE